MARFDVTALPPAGFRRAPWKNGGGVSVDIAEAFHPGHAPGDWAGMLWRFGRTAIVAPGPFSDLAGYDRMQVVVGGSGLVLDTPAGAIDVRRPFVPVRFPGEIGIASRLECGPVAVVNLIADRAQFEIDLIVLTDGVERVCPPGTHILYAAVDAAQFAIDGVPQTLAAAHALRLDAAVPVTLGHRSGQGLLLASILVKPAR